MTTSFDSDLSPDAIDTISVEHVTRDDDSDVTRVSGDTGGHVTRAGSNLSLGSDSSINVTSGRKISGKKMSVTSTLSSSSDKILFNMTSGYTYRTGSSSSDFDLVSIII